MTGPEAIARLLLKTREEARAVPVSDWRETGPAIADADSGYAIQAETLRIRTREMGQTAIGYKIGATNTLARELLGTPEPFYGRLYDASSSDGTGMTFVAGVHKVAEPEIALRIAEDLDPAGAPFDAAAIRAATGAVLPAIEIVASCFDPWIEVGAPTLIADNGAHGLWRMGTALVAFDHLDLEGLEVSVTTTRAGGFSGKGGAVDGGPFGAAAWLANRLAAQGLGLKAGDLISTGTVTPPIPLSGADRIEADFGALGHMVLEIQAPGG